MVRRKTGKKEKDQVLVTQDSQQTLKSAKSEKSLLTPEEDAISSILEHALEFNHKKSINDLNMLDVLNSYDELIKNFSLSSEQNTKIYRRLLQIQRDKGKQGEQENTSLSYNQAKVQESEESQTSSTLNQDLNFDFQGSFGILNKRMQSQTSHKRIQSTQIATQKGNRDSSKSISKATPTLMNSQFQSMASGGDLIKVSDYLSQRTQDNLIDLKLLNQRPPLYQSQSTSQFHSINHKPQASLLSESSKGGGIIKLPKLSFNDLIQAQNYDSFKRFNNLEQQDSTEYTQMEGRTELESDRLPEKQGPSHDQEVSDSDEELKSNEISVFKGSSNRKPEENSLLRYSNQKQTFYEQPISTFQNQRQESERLESTQNIALKLPKLRLLSEATSIGSDVLFSPIHASEAAICEDLQPRRQVPQPISRERSREIQPQRGIQKGQTPLSMKKKENVIDDNNKLAFAFQTRKLMLKGWKSWIVMKMLTIHNTHLKRLAQTYRVSKTKAKYLQHWKLYVKLILPEERLFKRAKDYYKLATLKRAFQLMREQAYKSISLKAKLISTRLVLRSQAMRRSFDQFKKGVLRLQIRRTQKYTSLHIKEQKLKLVAMRALQIWANFKSRERNTRQNSILFYQQTLARKAITGLMERVQRKKQKKRMLFKARVYFKNHYSSILKTKAFQVMKLFAVHNRKSKLASDQNAYWIQYKYFKTLKSFCFLSKGAKTQNEFVEKYSSHGVLVKVFKALLWNRQESQSKNCLIMNYLQRVRTRKLFRAFNSNREKRILFRSHSYGPLIVCAQNWLKHSFGGFMESVWAEFPKQRITHSTNGEPNYLLNYLGLAKNPKYRSFFFESNAHLRQHMMFQVLKSWQRQTSVIKGFKRRLQRDLMRNCLRGWRKGIYRSALLGKMVQNKLKKRTLQIVSKVFLGLKSQAREKRHLNKAFFKILLKRKLRILKKHLGKWNQSFKRQTSIRGNEEAADKIYRHRYLSTYLARWLQTLHGKLKGQHLDTLKIKFQKQVVRKRWLRTWYFQLKKHSYLELQEEQINQHQTNIVIYKAFNKLKAFTAEKQRKRLKIQAADDEYKFWLAKRAIIYMQQGLNAVKSQTQLFGYLEQETNSKYVIKSFQALKMFTAFKQDQRFKDNIMTQQIRSITKNRVMRTWRSKISKKLSCLWLEKAFRLAQMKDSFRQIIHLISFNESVVEVMTQKRDVYLKLQLFNLFKKNINHTRTLQGLHRFLIEKRLQSKTSSAFNHWLKLFQGRKRMYKTYAFTVIQLKNQIVKSVLSDWKQLVSLNRKKRNSQKYYSQKMKRRCFRVLKLNYLKNMRVLASSDYLKQAQRTKAISQSFTQWRSIFLEEQQVKQVQQMLKMLKTSNVFNALNNLKQKKQDQRRIFTLKKIQLNQVSTGLYLNKLRRITQARRQMRLKHQQAVSFNKQFMFRAALRAWVKYFDNNREHIQKAGLIRRNHQDLLRKQKMRSWIERADKRLRKVRALLNLNHMKNKRILAKRFGTWVDETNFLITLEQRVDSLKKKQDAILKDQAIAKLIHFCNQRRLYKQRKSDVIEYSLKKTKLKTIIGMRSMVAYRQRRENQKDQAFFQYCQWLKYRAIKQLRQVTVKNFLLRDQAVVMRQSQQRIFAPRLFRNLLENKAVCQQDNYRRRVALDFRITSLYAKAIQCLLINRQNLMIKNQLNNQARMHYAIKLVQKSLKKLYIFKSYQQHQTKRRQVITGCIKQIYYTILATQAFNLIKEHKQISVQESIKHKAQLKKVKTRRLFHLLRFHHQIKSEHRQAYQIVSGALNLKNKIKYFDTWRNLFFSQIKCQSYRAQKLRSTKEVIFQTLKGMWQIRKIQSMIKYQRDIKLKATVLTVFIQYGQYKQQSHYKSQQAQAQCNVQLARKVFASFAKLDQYQQCIQRGLANYRQSLQRRAIRGIAEQIVQKQKYNEYRKVTDYRISAKTFYHWVVRMRQRLEFKERMRKQLMKFEELDKRSTFNQWKRGAFFMRTCELIYTYRYKDEEEQTTKEVFREWRRLARHNRNKDYLYQSVESNHRVRSIRGIFTNWMRQVRGKLLALKLQKLVQPILEDSFYDIFEYASKEKTLSNQANKFKSNLEKKFKQKFFYGWMIKLEQREQVCILTNQKDLQLMKKAMKGLEMNRLKKMQDKYQMLRVISFFSQRRPELLLCFSKSFLCLNNQHSSSIDEEMQIKYARICSTALAKYVFEKWKNVKDVLQVQNGIARQGQRQYAISIAKKAFSAWSEQIQVKQSKRTLKTSCLEFHCVNLIKRAFYTLKGYSEQKSYKRELVELQQEYQGHKSFNLIKDSFYTWNNKFLSNYKARAFTEARDQKQYSELAFKCLQSLKNYTIHRQTKRLKLEKAQKIIEVQNYYRIASKYFQALRKHTVESSFNTQVKEAMNYKALSFYASKIVKRTFVLFKQQTLESKLKNKYSKLYTVFVAWKFFVKEKVLLKKYLNECNYQTLPTKSLQKSKSKPRTITYQKENIGGDNNSSLDFQVEKIHRQMSKQQLSIPSGTFGKSSQILVQSKDLFNEQNIAQGQTQMTPTLGSQFLKNQFTKMAKKETQVQEKAGFQENLNKGNSTLQIFKQRFYN